MGNTVTTYATIYAFGDSLSDAGNAYLLTNSADAQLLNTLGVVPISPEPVSPPYYAESYALPSGTLTADVFSNGPVWTQDLARDLNLGTLAPSGVGVTAGTLIQAIAPSVGGVVVATGLVDSFFGVASSSTYIPIAAGVPGATDFAIGGAVTGLTTENSSAASITQTLLTDLPAQLTTFDHDVGTPAPGALATVSVGANDVLAILEDSNFGTLYPAGTTLGTVGATQAGADVAQSVSIEAGFLGSLVAQGVSNIVVLNVPDLGVTPEIAQNHPSEVAAATVLSMDYDTLLAADIASLDTNPAAHITIDNAFTLIDNAVSVVNAGGSFDGITNVATPVYSGTFSAYVPADLISSNPTVQNQYLFFDHLHPTTPGETALANGALAVLGLTCFAPGTSLRTARGPVAVERLRLGDAMVLAGGGAAPVVWTGHRDVDCTLLADPRAAWPVRVRAHAFGRGTPARDVLLSPDHAVFTDSALIPVKYLIDGRTISQEPCRAITYWHVELPRHALLLAEGLPCESFLDTEPRADDGTVRPRRADYVSQVWDAEACAELVVAGPRLEAARARLRESPDR